MRNSVSKDLQIQLSGLPFTAWIILFGLIYIGWAWVNFNSSTTLAPFFALWLPGGVLATALVLSEQRRWGWFLGLALAANLSSGWLVGLDGRINLAFAFGSCFGAVIFALLPRWMARLLDSVQTIGQVTGQIAAAAAVGALANSGLAFLIMLGSPSGEVFRQGWGVWWIGHFLGIITVASLGITWAPGSPYKKINRPKAAEFILVNVLLAAGLAFLSSRDLNHRESLIFVTFPFMIYLAMRFGLKGASTAAFLLTLLASWNRFSETIGLPASEAALSLEVLPHQAYLALVILTGLSTAAYQEMLVILTRNSIERESREKLVEMEIFYRSLFEQSDLGMVVIDPHTQLPIEFNDAACRQLGYTRAEFARLRILDLDANEKDEILTARIQRITETGRETFEATHRAQDGSLHLMEITAAMIAVPDRMLLLTTSRDITEIKRAEAAQRESEARFRAVFEHGGFGIALVDESGVILECNRALTDMLGYSRAELIENQLTVRDLTYPEDLKDEARLINDVIAGQQTSFQFEKRYVHKDRHLIWARLSGTVVRDQHNQVLYTIGMIEDISARKLVETDLKDSKETLSSVFLAAPYSLSLSRLSDGSILDVNPGFEALTGYLKPEVVGKTALEAGLYESEEQRHSFIEKLFNTGAITDNEVPVHHKDGTVRTCLFSARQIHVQNEPCILVTMTDISERKRVEERLTFQAHLLDVVSQAIITTDLGGKITYWNRAAEEMYGWSPAEAMALNISDFVQSRSREESLDIINWLSSGGRWSGELQMKRRDQSTFLAQIDDMPIQDKDQRMVGVITVSQDITTRKSSEEALRKSNFMRDILSASLINTPLALIFWRIEKGSIEVMDWNPAAETIFGWMREEAVGRNFLKFLPAQPVDDLNPELLHLLEMGRNPKIIPSECRTRDNRKVLVNWFNTPMTDLDNTSTYVLSLGENITERIQNEEQIRVSLQEKEILLREVYHRVKNNLMVMISLIELQTTNISDPDTLAILKDLQSRIRTMALVHQSLYQSPSLSQVDFEGYLVNLISYLGSLYHSPQPVEITYAIENLSMRIETAIPCGLIINELVSNAYKYAFPMTATTSGNGSKAHQVHIGFQRLGDGYQLIVQDNGVGLPDDFDVRSSRSLGIQLVKILTNQIDGRLEVEQTGGTCFRITFGKFSEKVGGGNR